MVNGVALQAHRPRAVGHRLEVISSAGKTWDMHSNLAELPEYPARLTFFRPRRESWIVALNILFDVLNFDDIALDVLHVLDLGVARYCVGWGVVLFLMSDCNRAGQCETDY